MPSTESAIIDLRDASKHERDRPAGAVRLSHEDLQERAYLLPPRNQGLILVGGSAAAARPLLAGLKLAGRRVQHFPDETWRAHLQIETGPPSCDHLWRPAATVVRAANYRDTLPGVRALDLACGSGRNAVFLARCGFDVTAVDRRADALERTADLAARHHVSLHTLERDLETPGGLEGLSADLVVVVRFLERALFAPLATCVTPGGIVAYETFTLAQAAKGHPRRTRFMLQRGELRAAFPTLECLEYEEGEFDNAHVARLVARRPLQGA